MYLGIFNDFVLYQVTVDFPSKRTRKDQKKFPYPAFILNIMIKHSIKITLLI